MCSTHAAFVMTVAAVRNQKIADHDEISNTTQEMFIQFLAEQGNRVAKSEKKPRRNIQYADIGIYLIQFSFNRHVKLIKFSSQCCSPSSTNRVSHGCCPSHCSLQANCREES